MRFVFRDGKMVPWSPREWGVRADLPHPMVIRDSLDGVLNPVDGKRYDSKGAYYRAVKDHGCVIVGNEAKAEQPEPIRGPRASRGDVEKSIAKLEQGYKP